MVVSKLFMAYHEGIEQPISVTTRPKHDWEADGLHHHFVTPEVLRLLSMWRTRQSGHAFKRRRSLKKKHANILNASKALSPPRSYIVADVVAFSPAFNSLVAHLWY